MIPEFLHREIIKGNASTHYINAFSTTYDYKLNKGIRGVITGVRLNAYNPTQALPILRGTEQDNLNNIRAAIEQLYNEIGLVSISFVSGSESHVVTFRQNLNFTFLNTRLGGTSIGEAIGYVAASPIAGASFDCFIPFYESVTVCMSSLDSSTLTPSLDIGNIETSNIQVNPINYNAPYIRSVEIEPKFVAGTVNQRDGQAVKVGYVKSFDIPNNNDGVNGIFNGTPSDLSQNKDFCICTIEIVEFDPKKITL